MADNSWLYQNPNNSKFLNYGQNYNASQAFSNKPKLQPISPTNLKSWTPSYGTKADIVSFQKAMGLTPDGIIGPKTQAAYAQMGVNVPMSIKTGGSAGGSSSQNKTIKSKQVSLPEGQNVDMYMTPKGDVADGLIYPASAGIAATNNGTVVQPSALQSLDFAQGVTLPKDSEWAGQGENVLGYLGTPAGQQIQPQGSTTSSLGNIGFANGLSNSMELPNGQVSPSSGWDKYLSSFTTANKPYGSYGEAWDKGNGVLGGISNLWNQFTTEGGTMANPTASGLEKGMQGLGQLASLYGGIQQAKYQKDLMNLANRQQAFQEQQAQRVNSMQDQAQSNYDSSFK